MDAGNLQNQCWKTQGIMEENVIWIVYLLMVEDDGNFKTKYGSVEQFELCKEIDRDKINQVKF